MNAKTYREKRRFPRVCVQFDLIYKVNTPPEVRMRVGEGEIRASTFDISEGGMAIITERQIPYSTELEILFHLIFPDKQTPPIYAVGIVRYNTATPDGKGYRLGIQFINIDKNDKQTIADFIKIKSDSTA